MENDTKLTGKIFVATNSTNLIRGNSWNSWQQIFED
jgi:hypothetical protein